MFQAAHCLFRNISSVEVFIRPVHRKLLSPEATFEIDRSSDNLLIHENYDHSGYGINDIALIYVPDLTKSAAYVESIKLATNEHFFKNLQGKAVTVVGFGDTDADSEPSDVLKFANATVGEDEDCKESFEGAFDEKQLLCLLAEGTGTVCVGDSGDVNF